MKLTLKQERFCREYVLNGGNATDAAIKAGYSEKTARQIGQRLLTFVHIQQFIAKLKEPEQKKYEDRKAKIIKELEGIAFHETKSTPTLKNKLGALSQLRDIEGMKGNGNGKNGNGAGNSMTIDELANLPEDELRKLYEQRKKTLVMLRKQLPERA